MLKPLLIELYYNVTSLHDDRVQHVRSSGVGARQELAYIHHTNRDWRLMKLSTLATMACTEDGRLDACIFLSLEITQSHAGQDETKCIVDYMAESGIDTNITYKLACISCIATKISTLCTL